MTDAEPWPAEPLPIVLVADDDGDIRTLVAFALQRAGYEVVSASDGEEALRLAFARPPDLAVLDVMMPRLSGLDVTRRLRAEHGTHALPVILLSARVQEADIAIGREAGATDYVKKPFSPQDLRRRVQAILGR